MADNSGKLLTYGLIGVGGYFLYKWIVAPTPAASIASPAAAATPASSASAAAAPAAPAFNSLDQIYARLQAKAPGSSTADAFNTYLAAELPAGKQPPDPLAVFGGDFDRSQSMTLSNYWGAIAPYLQSTMGLSGLGLYGGLGRLIVMKRRRA